MLHTCGGEKMRPDSRRSCGLNVLTGRLLQVTSSHEGRIQQGVRWRTRQLVNHVARRRAMQSKLAKATRLKAVDSPGTLPSAKL